MLLMHASSALRKMDTQHAQDAGRVRRQLRAPKVLFSFPSSSLLLLVIAIFLLSLSFSSLYDALLEKDMKLTSSLCLLTVSLPRRRERRERAKEREREDDFCVCVIRFRLGYLRNRGWSSQREPLNNNSIQPRIILLPLPLVLFFSLSLPLSLSVLPSPVTCRLGYSFPTFYLTAEYLYW